MKALLLTYLLWSSMLFPLVAQTLLPADSGARQCYEVEIQGGKFSISGVCMMLNDGENINAAVFNEFGVTLLAFSYMPQQDKVQILQLVPALDRCLIICKLRRHLRGLMHEMQKGNDRYSSRGIDYYFAPLPSSTNE